MIDVKIVVITIISFFLAVISLNAINHLIKDKANFTSLPRLILTAVLIFIFAYLTMDVLHISLSVFIGIVIANFIYSSLSRKENIVPILKM